MIFEINFIINLKIFKMKKATIRNAALYWIITLSYISSITSLAITQKKSNNCEAFSSKFSWTKSSEFCGDSDKKTLTSLVQCQFTKVYKPFFGWTWFYCYPNVNNQDLYYRIELRSCIGFDLKQRSLVNRTKYNDFYSQPTLHNPSKSKFDTKCENKLRKNATNSVLFKFDVRYFMKFDNGNLVCKD